MFNEPIDTGYPDPNKNYDRAKPIQNDMEGAVDTLVSIYGLLTKTLQDQGKAAKDLTERNNNLIRGMGEVNKVIMTSMTAFNAAANIFHTTTTFMEKSIHSVAGSMIRFIEVASPVSVTMFTYALRDLNAIIGYALLPLFQRFTGVVRVLGDFFASLDSNGKKFLVFLAGFGVGITIGGIVLGTLVGIVTSAIAAFAGAAVAMTALAGATMTFTTIATGGAILVLQLFASILGLIGVGASGAAGGLSAMYLTMMDMSEIRKTIEPVLSAIVKLFSSLGKILLEIANQIGPQILQFLNGMANMSYIIANNKQAIEVVIELLKIQYGLILSVVVGLSGLNPLLETIMRLGELNMPSDPLKSSRGAAVQNVGLGSVDSFVNQLRQNALMSGMSPEQETAKNTGSIAKSSEEAKEAMKATSAILDKIYGLFSNPESVQKSFQPTTKDLARDIFTGVIEGIMKLMPSI